MSLAPEDTLDDLRLDRLLGQALSEPVPWPDDWDGATQCEAIVGRARYHGVAGILAGSAENLSSWPKVVRSAIKKQALAQAFWELRHIGAIGHLLSKANELGIKCVILKGTALAYDVYGEPATRARGDTDLLISPSDLKAMRDLLASLDFQRFLAAHEEGSILTAQELWQIDLPDGSSHSVDLHWSLFNALALRRLFSISECLQGARFLPRLSEAAQTMDRVLLLVHALLHRAQHIANPFYCDNVAHFGGERLIWAYDLRLLAQSLSADEWDRFCTIAEAKKIAHLCREGLEFGESAVGCPVPAAILERLRMADADGQESRYLLDASRFERMLMDLSAAAGLSAKAAYLRDLCFPPREFMRQKYPRISHLPLSLLYVRRILASATKFIVRGR